MLPIDKPVNIPVPGTRVVLTLGGETAVSDTLYRLIRYYQDADIVYAELNNEHTNERTRRTVNGFLTNFASMEEDDGL